jgi:hypothetical protein
VVVIPGRDRVWALRTKVSSYKQASSAVSDRIAALEAEVRALRDEFGRFMVDTGAQLVELTQAVEHLGRQSSPRPAQEAAK